MAYSVKEEGTFADGRVLFNATSWTKSKPGVPDGMKIDKNGNLFAAGPGGIQAFYFKDPDGHALEILQFPEGKGDPKWHRKSDKMFLGIDHTAIVVADTDTSLKFYRDLLGLQIAGTSENYGTEQEHLNNVFGARLRITSLHAAEGPGIEFLQYLTPRDGRPYPEDARANDLLHWQTKLLTHNTDAIAKRVGSGEYQLLSPGVVAISGNHLGFRKAITVRDPDGHVMQIVEK